MPSKKTKKNYKIDVIQHLNHQAQHKQHKMKIRETQAAIIQITMKDMINLITPSQKASSATIINLTKKKILSPKIIKLLSYTLSRLQLLLSNRGQMFTPTTKSNHFFFRDDFKQFKRRLQIKEIFNDIPFEGNSLVYNHSAKPVKTNNSNLQQSITETERVDLNYKYSQTT